MVALGARGAAVLEDLAERYRERVVLRSFLAVVATLPALIAVAFVIWLILSTMANRLYADMWNGTSPLHFDDVTKLDDAYRAGLFGTWDAMWARAAGSIRTGFENASTAVVTLLGTCAVLTALAQTYVSIAVGRRAGDAVPHESNLLHTVRRAPRVLVAWSVVMVATWSILVGAGRIAQDWPWYLEVIAALAANVAAWFLFSRMCFVVPIAVAEDDLVPGLGWAQCLGLSWMEVRGRTLRVFLRVIVLYLLPVTLVASPLQALAFGEGATGLGVGLAIGSQLTAVSVLMISIASAATALYVVDYRHD